jgi:hypothetical protein
MYESSTINVSPMYYYSTTYVSPKYYYSTIYMSPIYSSSELSYMTSIASAGALGRCWHEAVLSDKCVHVRP